MSTRLFQKTVVAAVLLATASLPFHQARADGMGPVSGMEGPGSEQDNSSACIDLPEHECAQEDTQVDLVESIKSTDEAALQKSALAQAEAIKQIPNDLRAQGIQIAPEQEAQLAVVSDKLAADANKPGLKKRMINALKKDGKKSEIVLLKGIGWGGEAALGVSIAPLSFGTDLVSAMFTGKGVFSSGQNGLPALIGEVGGITTLFYTFIGLDAIGLTFEGPLLASGLGIGLINQFVCPDGTSTKSPELKNYCEVNAKIMKTLWTGSAKGGQAIGAEAHKGIMAASRWVIKPFHHLKKAKKPAQDPKAEETQK